MKSKKKLLASTIAFFMGSAVQGAVAQEDVGSQEENGWALEEIVVTATRRDEKLQDVPLSVISLNPEEFTSVGLTKLSDIVAYAPGVSVSNVFGDPAGATITARGVGQQGRTATVGVYLDAVPLTSNGPWGLGGGFAFDGLLGDIERVEFLKGPQGTLYGATSIGGAVRYISRKPSLDELKGHAALDVSTTKYGGTNKTYNGRISMPLMQDKLGISIAGFLEDNGGLVDRVGEGSGALIKEDADSYEKQGVSGDLYYILSDQLSFRLRLLNQKVDYNGVSTVNIRDDKQLVYDSFANDIPYSIRSLSNTVYTGTAEYGIHGITISATSSYVEEDGLSEVDLIALGDLIDEFILGRPLKTTTAIPRVFDRGSKKFTQEIQFTSEESKNWEWILGLYYTDEETYIFEQLFVEPLFSFPDGREDRNLYTGDLPSTYNEHAVFGNITYYILPEFDLTFGARLSRNKMTYSQNDTGLLAASGFSSQVKDTVDTWSLAARYRPHNDLSMYARAASGYRPATANSQFLNIDDGKSQDFVQSDSLWSYEVGFKGSSFDSRLIYELAFWYLSWDDFQTDVSLSSTTVLVNASEGITAKGIEGSVTFLPTNSLTIISNFSYTKSTLNDDEPLLRGLEGQQLPNVPSWTFSSRALYDVRIYNEVDMSLGINVRYEDSSRSAFSDNSAAAATLKNIPTDSYVAVDFNSIFSWDSVSLSFYVTNLLDEQALVGTRSEAGVNTGVPLDTRTVGMGLSLNF